MSYGTELSISFLGNFLAGLLLAILTLIFLPTIKRRIEGPTLWDKKIASDKRTEEIRKARWDRLSKEADESNEK